MFGLTALTLHRTIGQRVKLEFHRNTITPIQNVLCEMETLDRYLTVLMNT